MQQQYIIDELKRNINVFDTLLAGISPEQYKWRSEEAKWCLLEIVCHLYDEEQLDFKQRLKHILNTPDEPMEPIDPPAWVNAHKYMEQDFQLSLEKFKQERHLSITWLNELGDAAWNNVYQHPKLGKLSATMMLSNWLAHDLLHIRQIVATKYKYLQSITGEDLSYAGGW
jgi:hypothetical protein